MVTGYSKKLIEVALPLAAINKACAREKSIRHGHPSTLHLWWARRPLAAARAVVFAQMVDDPSAYVDVLRGDPMLRRRAETALKARLKLWDEACIVAEEAKGSGLPVPEPGPAPTLEDMLADQERQRLFRIIEDLVLWENTTNETVLQAARDEIWQSWRRACAENADHPRASELFDRHKLPAFHDPFAGGGALPLEAQRLGLESYASDLNPVAVLINKAMIEIPPKFAGMPPVNPEARKSKDHWSREWKGAQGLAEDVRYYGQWMRDEAEKRIGQLYPKVGVTTEMAKERPDLKPYVNQKLTVIACLWARTVKSPNPAFANEDVPITSSFVLSQKVGREVYVEVIIQKRSFHFIVRTGKPQDIEAAKNGTKLSRGSFKCIYSGISIPYEYIDMEANSGRMNSRLMAIVAEGDRGRVYLSPTEEFEKIGLEVKPIWKPDAPSRGTWASNAQGRKYGFRTFGDYFTSRQLVTLTTFSDLIDEVRQEIIQGAKTQGINNDGISLDTGGIGALAYSDAVATYLAFAVSKLADRGSTICAWDSSRDSLRNTFGRQAIQMTWDYAEANCLSESSGSYNNAIDQGVKVLQYFQASKVLGYSFQADAASQSISLDKVISSDPPYYDNIGYADLSDFFYVWLRRSLKLIFPKLFATVAVPKTEELVAERYRHGSNEKAEKFFLGGMTKAMQRLSEQAHPSFPVTIYYAFKQSEGEADGGITNTGWDAFLEAVINAGFTLTGTWPVRTELGNRMISSGTNALASSIVLVCRKQVSDAPPATRGEFVNTLRKELPIALAHLQRGNIAPVDLAQAAIGPGMAVFTRYSQVLDAQGKRLSVRQALALINETLDEALAEQEGDFDADTRWALAWFEQSGFAEGEFGVADVLARAKDTSISGMVEAGILASGHGKVRLLKPAELPKDWDPNTDKRLTAWEMVHQLIRVLEKDGEGGAAQLMAKLGARAETARELCYRLYTLCERKKRAAEAHSYNALVQSWPEAARLARETSAVQYTQRTMFVEGEG